MKGGTACIFRYKSKRREAVPSWELRIGKPTATLPNTRIQKHTTLSYNGKGCQSSKLWPHAINVPLQSTFLGRHYHSVFQFNNIRWCFAMSITLFKEIPTIGKTEGADKTKAFWRNLLYTTEKCRLIHPLKLKMKQIKSQLLGYA